MTAPLNAELSAYFSELGHNARKASRILAAANTQTKNAVLLTAARLLQERAEAIYAANEQDLIAGRKKGLSEAFLDRLKISEKVLNQMIEGLKQIASLTDPIGQVFNMQPQPSGIQVGQMRVPLGVIGIIYESRPNVTIDAAALCLKSGNATILRGGSDAQHSNNELGKVIAEALAVNGLPSEAVQVIKNPDRALVGKLITSPEFVDVIIPRGGKSLIARLMEDGTVPMIKHLNGICHTYVDKDADLDLSVRVTDNAKTQRYSPCNATETLLIHQSVIEQFLPRIAKIFSDKNVEMRCDEPSMTLLTKLGFKALVPATEEDWTTEYNAPIISIKQITSLDEAIDHINRYGSHHTDAILTDNYVSAEKFLKEVDSASVMVNTSTRFADGFEYGLGAEIGISTDKLHARGPVGLNGLTSVKYIVLGHGEIRQ